MAFTGFSTDELIGLPPEFFTEVSPFITLPSELKVTLHIFYRLSRQRRQARHPRRISWDELGQDRVLRQGLRAISKVRSPEELLEEGINAAVRRGSLLHVAQPGDGRIINWYLVNTAANRAWLEQVGRGWDGQPAEGIAPEQRPSVLALYEQNIGLITPLLLDELREAEERYPPRWVEEAIREAVRSNVRSWRYVRKVLERWESNGRGDATDRVERHCPIDVEKYTSGAFGRPFRLGSDTGDC
ncbi:MAG: DnaD domain protein [Chloroflexaceae bacterium]|nr:DnaD domain protein [Chloroflexaceae bacterium]